MRDSRLYEYVRALDYLSYAPKSSGEAGLRHAHHVSAELFRPSLVP